MEAREMQGHTVAQGDACASDGCDSMPVQYTVFSNVKAETAQARVSTWGEFVSWVQALPVSDSKDACSLVKGATFGDTRSEKGSLRYDDNMCEVYFIEGDYDDENVSIEEAAQRLRAAGVEALLCTTGRHTPGAPRWRVFAPLFMPCKPGDRKRRVAALNGALGGILARESFSASQSYYVGAVKGVTYEVVHVPGEPIDTNVFVADVYPSGFSAEDRIDDDDTLPEPVDAETLADLASAVKALPDSRADDYQECLQVLQNLKHFGWCGFADEAEQIAREFCQRSPKFREGWFIRKWRRGLHPWRGHYKTIFKLAQDDGWTNPRKKPDGESVLEFLRTLSQAEIIETWAKHAARLSPENAGLVVLEVERRTGLGKRPLNASLRHARTQLKRERLVKAAGSRKVMTYLPENSAAIAQVVCARILNGAPPEDFFVYAGQVSRIVESEQPYAHAIDATDKAPTPTIQIEAHSAVTVRAQIEAQVIFQLEQRNGPSNIAVPPAIVDSVLELPAPEVPRVAGLLHHPIVLADGSIVAKNGLDSRTGLFVHGVHEKGVRPFTQDEARGALARLTSMFLVGFQFASKFNQHVALAGLFTAVQRRVMDSAPGLAILAPVQSSGKTTLARRIHVVLTRRDMPVVTLPVGHDDEIEKRLLALLLRSPAMITFDNVPDGLTVNGGSALNGAFTAPEFEGRLLGSTRTLCVPSNAFFCLTGNNLRLGKDEVTRWLTSTLAPAGLRPEERRFRFADVVAHAREIRSQVLGDVVGIVSGYLRSGADVKLKTGSRFAQWDRLVRQPLVWAGAEDPALCFQINSTEAEHTQALRRLMLGLIEEFKDERFSARQVAGVASGADFSNTPQSAELISDALSDLQCRDPRSSRSVGRALNAIMNRSVELDGIEVRIVGQVDRNDITSFRIQECGVVGV